MPRPPNALEPSGFYSSQSHPSAGGRALNLHHPLITPRVWTLLGIAALLITVFLWGYFTTKQVATMKFSSASITSPADFASDRGSSSSSGQATQATLALLHSRDLAKRVAESARLPGVFEGAADLKISHDPATGLFAVQMTGRNPRQTLYLAETFQREAVKWAAQIGAQEGEELHTRQQNNLSRLDQELERASSALLRFQNQNGLTDYEAELAFCQKQQTELGFRSDNPLSQIKALDLQIDHLLEASAKQNPALLKAREDLQQAEVRYTDEHPKVKELRALLRLHEARLAELKAKGEVELSPGTGPISGGLALQVIDLQTKRIGLQTQLDEIDPLKLRLETRLKTLSEQALNYVRLNTRYQSLKEKRLSLLNQQQNSQLALDPPGLPLKVFEPAHLKKLSPTDKLWSGFRWAGLAGFVLLIVAAVSRASAAIDGRIRTPSDLQRVTKLPVLGSMGDLRRMTEKEKERWGYSMLTLLRRRVNRPISGGFVCGVTSARNGEGRSAWIRLLADAALKSGDKVLLISTEKMILPSPAKSQAPAAEVTSPALPSASRDFDLSRNLTVPDSPQLIQLTIPGDSWHQSCRKQWQDALNQWEAMENLVVLVDLPPASEPETMVLADLLPNMIWLSRRGMSHAAEIRFHLTRLGFSSGTVGAAIFNAGPAGRWKNRLAGLAGLARLARVTALLVGLRLAAVAGAAEPNQPSPTNEVAISKEGSFSSSPRELANWQKRLVLGPGDILDLSLYGEGDSARLNLAIGPDGRLNYLEARDILAAGSTVDELRTTVENALAKYRLEPRLIMIPVAYHSKKYYVLGNVRQKGVFRLDRPTTIIEAVASARGFVSAFDQRNTLMVADLARSFLVRKKEDGAFERVPVDFEGLFLRGDLSQNQQLAPDDYLYFPPLDLQEVYVLGAVPGPGITPYTPDLTVLRAIVSRGGFVPGAYRSKVLVIRGSLSRPTTYVVNAGDILAARTVDFKLEPRDIVYVSRKPWAKVEELLESAITDFARGAVVTWAGLNVGPFIK